MQTSIFSLDFFLFRFRLSSQGSSRPLFFRCDYSDRFRCQSKVGIFCKSCVRVETTLRASLSLALLRFLKYQFWKKSLRKNVTLSSWILFQHICPHFWAWLLLYSAITPKSEVKYVVKVFNSTELHFSEVYFFQNWYFNNNFGLFQLETIHNWC